MSKLKKILYVFILVAGLMIIYFLGSNASLQKSSPMSFVPVLKVAGTVPLVIDRAVTTVLPINDLDEEKLGNEIKEKFKAKSNMPEEDKASSRYLNELIKTLTIGKNKKFQYEVFIMQDIAVPNAMALPGGVILVTSGLLNTLQSESELVSILAHEIGHVELSHCLNSVKYELLMKKISFSSLGELADIMSTLLYRHSYSKIQEEEADDFSTVLINDTTYDPNGMYQALKRLDSSKTSRGSNDIVTEYFLTHPYLDSRIRKHYTLAAIWWNKNPGSKRYIGFQNFKDKVTMAEKSYLAEFEIR